MSIETEGVNGISGSNKICTLQPFEVLEIIEPPEEPQEEPVDENPIEEPQEEPQEETIDQLFDKIITSLQSLKKKIKAQNK